MWIAVFKRGKIMRHIAKMAAAVVTFAWVGAVSAAPITGSFAFADGASETGQSLLTRTSFTVTNATTQNGNGDFSSILTSLPVLVGTFSLPGGTAPTATVSPSDFRASFEGGTFVADTVRKVSQSVTTAGNESITGFFLGTFTPAGTLASFDPSPTSVIVNLNRSGSNGNFSVASAFTLASPPANDEVPISVPVPSPEVTAIPEPASIALLGIGFLGIAAARRRLR